MEYPGAFCSRASYRLVGAVAAAVSVCASHAVIAGSHEIRHLSPVTPAGTQTPTRRQEHGRSALTCGERPAAGIRSRDLLQVADASASQSGGTSSGGGEAGEGQAASGNPKALEGQWFCPKAFIMEAGGPGATTLKLKGDGVYVIQVRPANHKDRHLYREYGTWTATGEHLSRTHKWWQRDSGKLDKLRGITNTHNYSLESNGAVLVLDGLKFKRVGSAATAGR